MYNLSLVKQLSKGTVLSDTCVGPVRAVNLHALLGQRRDFRIYRVFRQLVRGSPVRGEES